MPGNESIACAACPNHVCPDRDAYREHCDTKWHKFNLNQRMFGYQVLTEEEYLAKEGGGAGMPQKAAEKGPPEKEVVKADDVPAGMVTVCITFHHDGEKYSHKFLVKQGSSIWDLKRAMIRPSSPPEDLVSFSLKRGMLRMPNFETLDRSDTLEFQFVGPEEGQRLFDKDAQRRDREEAEALERQRQREEAEGLAREQRRLKAERERQDGAEKSKQQERKREEQQRREEEKRRAEEEEQGRRLKEEQERESKRKEEERRRHKEEEEEQRRCKEEEQRLAEGRRREEQRLLQEARQREEEEEEDVQRLKDRLQEEQRSACGGAEGGERGGDPAAAAQVAGSTSVQALEIVLYIDRDLDLKHTFELEPGATVRTVKDLLARADATGKAKPEDFGLLDPLFGMELDNEDPITQALAEVDVHMKRRR